MLKNNLKFRANFSFYQVLSIGLAIFVLLIYLSINLYPKIILMSKTFFNKLDAVCGCANYLSFTNHPTIFTSLIIAGIVLLGFFSFAIFKTIKLRKTTNKFIKNNLKKQKTKYSYKLNKISQRLEIQDRLDEINDSKPIIFCYGLIKSRICISAGLVKKLSEDELNAVLLHEKHHLLVGDPLKLFLVKLISKILFFIPGIRYLANQYIIHSELLADAYATNSFKNKVALASALDSIFEWEEQLAIRNNLALSFFSDNLSTNERINKLADNHYSPKFKVITPRLIASVLMLISSLIYFNNFVSINTQIIKEGTMHCLNMTSDVAHTCEEIINSNCSNIYNAGSNLPVNCIK